ncbi:P-loop NTPase fold protein [Thermococcus sp. AM4]|uniref:KAP family P-loop NTPase fold protein n=1 Tax=Thermococcus sp. (strain AM4) TaxID=246969 RepID=UPI00018706E8|nr:P-loop NTPase fold protein [Thermococcus sp. AM4]EEB74261.1 hypothetical protein TAM4_1628 [Thermococcus sp. AM4]
MSEFIPQIIPDVPVEDSFKDYVTIVSEIITNSEPPRFTIGVFGGWGIGKTSFLKSLEKHLNDNQKNIVVVFFNAWRYERENHYATLPLLKSIYFALKNWESKNSSLRETTKEKLRKTLRVIEGIIKNTQIGFGVPGTPVSISTGFGGSFDSEKENVEILSEISPEKNIYYDVLRYLEDAIKELRTDNPKFRIVVLVDDLDRCAPDKAIEILNSIKIFLDIEGIIYVIALNPYVTKALLQKYYEKVGYSEEYSSEDYLSKFFQVRINLPEWDKEEIAEKIIDDIFKKTKLSYEVTTERLNKIRTKIVNALEESLTPREIKRFLNTFILRYALAKSINKKEKLGIKSDELLEIVLDMSIIDYLWHELVSYLEKGSEEEFSQLQGIVKKEDTNLSDYDFDLKEEDIEKLRDLLGDSPLFKQEYPVIKKILKIRSTIGKDTQEDESIFLDVPFSTIKKHIDYENLHSLAFTHTLNLLSKHYGHNNILIEPVIKGADRKRIRPDIIVMTEYGYILVEIKIAHSRRNLDMVLRKFLDIHNSAPRYLGKPLEKTVVVLYGLDSKVFRYLHGKILSPPLSAKVEITRNLDAIKDERTKGKLVIILQSIEEVTQTENYQDILK